MLVQETLGVVTLKESYISMGTNVFLVVLEISGWIFLVLLEISG